MKTVSFHALNAAGLNLQAVFDLAQLPAATRASIAPLCEGRDATRLLLIGHAGRRLWSELCAAGISSDDPIDDYSISVVERWCEAEFPTWRFRRLYPGDDAPGLQQLGRLAGWHHPSPFMLGIRPGWGTWFAYRVVLITDAPLEPTAPVVEPSPCDACADKPCVTSCPARAMEDGIFELQRCVDHRLTDGSPCADRCLARLTCPIGTEHRYVPEQIRHTYTISLEAIRAWAAASRGPRAESGAR